LSQEDRCCLGRRGSCSFTRARRGAWTAGSNHACGRTVDPFSSILRAAGRRSQFLQVLLQEGEELGSNILRVIQRSLAPRGVLDPTFWEGAGSSPPRGEERESGRAEFLADWPAPLACSAQVGLFRFFVGVVCLAALSAASLANRIRTLNADPEHIVASRACVRIGRG
jgi:hypothetical protein